MQKIVPFLWFPDNRAEEAVKFYRSVFKRTKIVGVMHYGEPGPGPKGDVMCITFQIEGQDIVALNGNADFKFTQAISLLVRCRTQKEVDTLWNKLSKSGRKIYCGWLTDKFGVTWQIVPIGLMEMMQDKNQTKADRVMRAMMKMAKLDIGKLKKAYKA